VAPRKGAYGRPPFAALDQHRHRARRGLRQWAQFAAGGALAVLYFAAIILTTGPQYVPLLKRVFHVAGS